MTYPEGIDVSVWNGDITNVLKTQQLVIVKISQSGFLDPMHEHHLADAQASDTEYQGGYHWLDPTPSAEAQAALYLRHVPAFLDFHAVDVEGQILKLGTRYSVARDMARRFIAYVHAHDHRPILQYSSRGTWPGDNGQDGNWVADYGGDPYRLSVRLTFQAVPWVIWQYSDGGGKLDHNRYKPDELAKLCGRTTKPPVPKPVPAPAGGTKVKFIQINADDVKKLPSMALTQPTPIETFDGEKWDTVGPTNVHYIPGLVDAHSNRVAVVISTGRFFKDGLRRYVAQVAVLP